MKNSTFADFVLSASRAYEKYPEGDSVHHSFASCLLFLSN